MLGRGVTILQPLHQKDPTLDDVRAIAFAPAFDPAQSGDERRALVQALHKELRVRMQRSGGLLCFNGNEDPVHTPENATLSCGIASEKILTWHSVLAAVTLRTLSAHPQAEQMFQDEVTNDAEAFRASQGVSGESSTARVG